jgi:hypothetical protein
LLRDHGEDASALASQRADQLFARGDFTGEQSWLSILAAIEELRRPRRTDDSVH